MKKYPIIRLIMVVLCMVLTVVNAFGQSDSILFLNKSHAMIRVKQGKKYILLPIEEKAGISNIGILVNNDLMQKINVRLAVDNIDY